MFNPRFISKQRGQKKTSHQGRCRTLPSINPFNYYDGKVIKCFYSTSLPWISDRSFYKRNFICRCLKNSSNRYLSRISFSNWLFRRMYLSNPCQIIDDGNRPQLEKSNVECHTHMHPKYWDLTALCSLRFYVGRFWLNDPISY